MDLIPAHNFIRGDRAQPLTLAAPVTLYKYLCAAIPAHATIIEKTASRLGPNQYLTPWRYYTRREAVEQLALPGPAPTHVLELRLSGDLLLIGPGFIEPLPPVHETLPHSHVPRPGNGIEFLLPMPFSLTHDNFDIHLLP